MTTIRERINARNALQYALRTGKVVKPANCKACGASGKLLHGHHEDHAKRLDVTWLCSACHGVVHSNPHEPVMAKKIVPDEVKKFFSDMGKKGGPAAARARWDGVSKRDRSLAMKELRAKRTAKEEK